MSQPVYIVSAARTPIGSFMGALSSVTAPTLGSTAIAAALKRARVDPNRVDEVYMGNVLSAGVGQAPARQAALHAGLSHDVPCTTVGKVCGSGLQAVVLGARAIALGDASIVVSGGMESMSNAPYYLPKARTGYRMGHGEVVDGMILDGLWDPYNDFHMGKAGEMCAREFELTREDQDAFAKQSYARALAAQQSGAFTAELTSVEIPQRKGDPVKITEDEEPARGNPDKFGQLRPAFQAEGTITAANASSINDGAAALVLAGEDAVAKYGLEAIARVESYAAVAQAPEWFTTAPARAMEQACRRAGVSVSEVDLFEINEAFACVTMACSRLCGIDPDRVNVHGGAVALGHPIGASGARVLTTLVHAMLARGAKSGLASLCIGGGEGIAVLVRTL